MQRKLYFTVGITLAEVTDDTLFALEQAVMDACDVERVERAFACGWTNLSIPVNAQSKPSVVYGITAFLRADADADVVSQEMCDNLEALADHNVTDVDIEEGTLPPMSTATDDTEAGRAQELEEDRRAREAVRQQLQLIEGRREGELAEALDAYTDPKHPEYDPEFDADIRRLRPDWFPETATA